MADRFWFQMARGRAIRRTNLMKQARRIKNGLYRLQGSDRTAARLQIATLVSWARQENRTWRKYRKNHLESQQVDQAIDAGDFAKARALIDQMTP